MMQTGDSALEVCSGGCVGCAFMASGKQCPGSTAWAEQDDMRCVCVCVSAFLIDLYSTGRCERTLSPALWHTAERVT